MASSLQYTRRSNRLHTTSYTPKGIRGVVLTRNSEGAGWHCIPHATPITAERDSVIAWLAACGLLKTHFTTLRALQEAFETAVEEGSYPLQPQHIPAFTYNRRTGRYHHPWGYTLTRNKVYNEVHRWVLRDLYDGLWYASGIPHARDLVAQFHSFGM
jgi:hypothetical protein